MMRPQTEADLASILADARDALAIEGGGTRGLSPAGAPLSTAEMSGVELYEPGALTIVAGVGTPVAEIDALLASEKQRLAFEPMDHRAVTGRQGVPTIGGVVAGNISGPRRIQVGACRDHLLGVRLVDGAGTVIKNGGRVMKNVTGYDLVKLMAGSWGTLGVLSQVSLKVLPMSETETTVILHGVDPAVAVDAMARALGSPFDVSGAAYGVVTAQAAPVVVLRVEGFEASVAYRAAQLVTLLGNLGEISLTESPQASQGIWNAVRSVAAFEGTQGDVWRISVKPSDAPAAAARIDAKGLLFDWGGGLIWARVTGGTDVRRCLSGISGHATLVRGAPETRTRLGVFQPQPGPLETISAGLRARFDPRGILNPGLMQSPVEA